MKRSEMEELRRLLKLFLLKYDLNKPNVLRKNETAKFIKDELKQIGRWRNLSRGKFKRKERIPNSYSAQQKERKANRLSGDCPF